MAALSFTCRFSALLWSVGGSSHMCVLLCSEGHLKKDVHNSPRGEFDYVDVYVFYCFPPGRMDLLRKGKGFFADSHGQRQNVG